MASRTVLVGKLGGMPHAHSHTYKCCLCKRATGRCVLSLKSPPAHPFVTRVPIGRLQVQISLLMHQLPRSLVECCGEIADPASTYLARLQPPQPPLRHAKYLHARTPYSRTDNACTKK